MRRARPKNHQPICAVWHPAGRGVDCGPVQFAALNSQRVDRWQPAMRWRLLLAIHLMRQDKSDNIGGSLGGALTLPATFAFAGLSTLSDAPTAVPFFAGAALIQDLAVGRIGQYLWIVAYCLVYVAPLLAMIAIRGAMQDRATSILAIVQRAIVWSFRHLFPPILLLGACWLCWTGAERLTHLS